MNQLILKLEEVLIPTGATSPQQMNVVLQLQSDNAMPSPSQQHVPKAKLPKLKVEKFNGRIQEWQGFWDVFKSLINKNNGLSAVDKFSYLGSLVQEPARSTIAGFTLREANYEEAVRVLKKHCGKGTAIQQAHINDLLSLPLVYSDRDTPRSKRLYDRCEMHY